MTASGAKAASKASKVAAADESLPSVEVAVDDAAAKEQLERSGVPGVTR